MMSDFWTPGFKAFMCVSTFLVIILSFMICSQGHTSNDSNETHANVTTKSNQSVFVQVPITHQSLLYVKCTDFIDSERTEIQSWLMSYYVDCVMVEANPSIYNESFTKGSICFEYENYSIGDCREDE